MPTPNKPFAVLKSEGKSHRTKAELKQREQGEKALSSGVALKERPEVKRNKVAHKEFNRINDLLKNIQKNDAIYETVINRYCLMYAECVELQEQREQFVKMYEDLTEHCKECTDGDVLLELINGLYKVMTGINKIDSTLQSKRKMLLDIEKENIMTIASALRCIPKKEEKSSNKLLEALNGS